MVDSHCHLDFPDFEDDRDAILARARKAGIGTIVTISTRVRRYPGLRALVETHDRLYCSIGTHPHNAAEEPEVTADELVAIAGDPKVVAIGEAGLDYHYDNSPRAAQCTGFLRHIEAARRTQLPLVIHARDADAATLGILGERARGLAVILHCFSMVDRLDEVIDRGWYASFAGPLTFKPNDALRAAAARMPADRILVETDSPYLAPVPRRGKPNQPAYVADTLAVLADVRGLDIAACDALTTANAARVFAW